jgi:phage terminase small subunit
MTDTSDRPKLTINQIINIMLEPEHRIDPRLVKFIQSYLECRHIREAEKLAGLSSGSGKRILNKPDVQACMLKINETLGDQAAIDASAIIARTKEIVDFDIADIFTEDGRVKDIKDIPPAASRVIKKLVVREVYEKDMNGQDVFSGYIKTVEFFDKMKGIELLGSQVDLFNKKIKHEHDVGNNLASLLLNSEKRALGHTASETIKMTKDPYLNAFAMQASTVEVVDDSE